MRATRRRFRITLTVLTAALLASPRALAGGGVLIVDDDGGPGVDFTDIPPAVAAALDGDRILVRDGDYSAFTVDGKTLTVRATGSDAGIDGLVRLRNGAPDTVMRLIGFRLDSTERALLIESNLGPISVTDCVLSGGNGANDPAPGGTFDGFAAVEVLDCAAVSFIDCEAEGGFGADLFDADHETGATAGGPGLSMGADSNVYAYDSVFTGGFGGSVDDTEDLPGARGGHGASMVDGFLFAEGCTFRGRSGGSGGCGCGATCCSGGGSGGDGLRLDGSDPLAHYTASVFIAGNGGPHGDGSSSGSPGLPIRILAGEATQVPAAAPPFCFGDGSGVACPCGNPGPPRSGCANSSGAGAVLSASGTTSTVFDDLQLAATHAIPGQVGVFFQGASLASLSFADGILCAGNPIVRLELVTLDNAGAASSSVPIAERGGVSPGDRRYYQLWFRDPSGPCSSGSNLSGAVQVDWH